MSSDAAIPKPSQLGDCPACNHAFPANKVCPGGPAYCGGPREGCPRCGQPVPTDIVPPGIVPPEPARLDDILPIRVEPLDMSLTYTPALGTHGKYGRWGTYHDNMVCEIVHAMTRQRVVYYHQGLGRTEREALLPQLVQAIEGVIDAAEGG